MLHKPVIILANPLCGYNIGSIVRIMANFGLHDLRVVKSDFSQFELMLKDAQILATNNNLGLLYQHKRFLNIKSALADLEYVLAFTCRPHNNYKSHYEMPEAMPMICNDRAKVGFLYGNEKWGLENCELELANATCVIPTANKSHSSLNLAQSVAVSICQWFQTASKTNTNNIPVSSYATIHELELLCSQIRTIISENGYDISKRDLIRDFYSFCMRQKCTKKDLGLIYKIVEFLSSVK